MEALKMITDTMQVFCVGLWGWMIVFLVLTMIGKGIEKTAKFIWKGIKKIKPKAVAEEIEQNGI